MQANWIIISVVIALAIGFIAYLIRQNQKDEKKVIKFFNDEASNFHDEESELNDEK